MGLRGPAPEPLALRALKNTNHKPPPTDTVSTRIPSLIPDPPDWLSEEAVTEWYEVVELMSAVPGWLTKVNKTTLAGHCHWYAVWMEHERILAKEKRFYEVVQGIDEENNMVSTSKKLHPAGKIAKEAWQNMLKCDQELGITPARGSSVHLPANSRDDELGLDKPRRVS